LLYVWVWGVLGMSPLGEFSAKIKLSSAKRLFQASYGRILPVVFIVRGLAFHMTKIMKKKIKMRIFLSKRANNLPILTKNILILRTFGNKSVFFSTFSQNFCQCTYLHIYQAGQIIHIAKIYYSLKSTLILLI